ncbi:MAG TPA: hypothetical protein VHQ90_01770 [Thermoanaerobaculia bacterium]|nr:hypothetical protein [Thermoanaerobaculia bacterium]
MRAQTRNICLPAVALLLAVNQAALAGSFQPGNVLTAPGVHFDKTNGYVVRVSNVSEDATGVQVTLYDSNGKTLKSVHRSLAAHALWSANLRDWSKSIGTADDPALGAYMIFAGDQAVLIGGGFSLGPEGPTGGSFISSAECDRCKTFWVFWSGGGGFHTDMVIYNQPSLTGSNQVRVTPYDDTGSRGDSVVIDNPPTSSTYDVANLVAGAFNGGDRTSGTLKVELPSAGGDVRVRIFSPSGKAEEERGWCDIPPVDLSQPPPPPPSAAACKSFAATPAAIASGDHATLSWSVSNAQSGSIDQGVGSVAVPSGFAVVSPVATTKYTLTLQGNDGSTVSCSTTVGASQQEPPCSLPTLSGPASASGKVGIPFSLGLQSSGGTLNASSLPPGLALNGSTIGGTPTKDGTYNVQLTAAASCGMAGLKIAITIQPGDQPPPPGTCTKPTLGGPSSASGKVGIAFSLTLQASGANLTAGSLPPGLSLYGNVIGGTPTREGVYDVQLVAASSCGKANLHITITVEHGDQPPAPPGCKEPYAHVPDKVSGKVGKSFYLDLKVTGTLPLEYSPKDLPEGVELDTDHNELKGTPTKKGCYYAVIRAHNSCGKFNQKIEIDVKGENEDGGGGGD